MKSSNKIALIHTQFGPYHFARAKNFIQKSPVPVRLIQLASQEAQREWVVDFDTPEVITVANGTLEAFASKTIVHKLVEHLNKISPSLIAVAGYRHPAMRAATRWARRHNVATVLLSDSQYLDRPRNPVIEKLKSLWIRKNFDAAFVAGASASLYLSNLGFPRNRIWRGYDVVDNNYFFSNAETTRQQEKEIRKKLSLSKYYFLYVGRFSPEKNLLRLLKAYQAYCHNVEQTAWSLVLVGSGPQETELKTKATDLGLKNVFWLGFKQINELPTYYALASSLILPSVSEPWGLVVNEAMACGLPILISDRCGCVPDLVFPGINGYLFDAFDVDSIASAMISISRQSNDRWKKMQHSSRQIIANYTTEQWSQALLDAIESTLNS
ncbi:glycosyltransferase family 4 protein [Oxynema sp. CENA135]|uniref:glycosyltransferase family 4 protein n=1 Tax=Oxynema sp. CENA135 TaxID=984206 RepID=UPI00190B6F16|nr:glycosyltransferase family 4 protein [Oxynema sp. CENA135]